MDGGLFWKGGEREKYSGYGSLEERAASSLLSLFPPLLSPTCKYPRLSAFSLPLSFQLSLASFTALSPSSSSFNLNNNSLCNNNGPFLAFGSGERGKDFHTLLSSLLSSDGRRQMQNYLSLPFYTYRHASTSCLCECECVEWEKIRIKVLSVQQRQKQLSKKMLSLVSPPWKNAASPPHPPLSSNLFGAGNKNPLL